MKSLTSRIVKLAKTDCSVILEGESGVGKEVMARAIHHNSLRSEYAFIAINCSNLQENLFESELFGHEQGAFTGAARQKSGLIEVADRGTLFVDEVADMKPGIQAKLLRVIETGTFRRVGGNREIHADIRLVVASNRSLHHQVSKGNMREDLYFRLNVIALEIPPLRDRKEDIPALAAHFLAKLNKVMGEEKTLSDGCLDILVNYSWPGNVRELSNAIERAMILSAGPLIQPADLAFLRQENIRWHTFSLKKMEQEYIQKVLKEVDNNKTHAAQILGISVRNLHRKINDFGLERRTSV